MMMSEIGTFIRSGMPTEEIQKQIKDFPTEFTTEYFESLGYEQVEAIRYKVMLRQNDRRKEELKKECARKELDEDIFIISDNADPNNILIDVCALGYKTSEKVIEKSEKVSVLYETIKEMDKVAHDKRKVKKTTRHDRLLLENISRYALKMLLEKTKYELIPYENNDLDYVDDKIIEYLKSQKPRHRPTLLTADKLLTAKADCLGFNFIFTTEALKSKDNEEENQEEIEEKENEEVNIKDKKIDVPGANIAISFINQKATIGRLRPSSAIFVVKEEECKEISRRTEIDISDFDYIVALQKVKGQRKVKVFKVYLEKTKLIKDIEECETINDIYRLDLHSTVQNRIKTTLI